MNETPTQTATTPEDPFKEVQEWQQADAVESARRLADEEAARDTALAAEQRRKTNKDTVIAVGSMVAAAAVLTPLAINAADSQAEYNASVGQTAIDQQNASDAQNSFNQGLDNGKVTIDMSTPAPEVTTIPAPEQIDPNLPPALPLTVASPDTH